ncbi:MAG: sporulation protein YunB [Clostridia bacterium]|nr:sporulation protein YunB [Clostridia bacterium]
MAVRRRRDISRKSKKRIFVLVIIFVLMFVFFEMRLRPVVRGVASVQAQSLTTTLINQTVPDVLEEMNITSADLETITQNNSGIISSINVNTVTVNKLKNIISLRIQENISQIQNRKVYISLGTILGSEFFNGCNPSIPLNISLSGNVKSDFESTFESGGVNQTVHKLSVKISADINIIMPMGTFSTTVETSVLVGETVIVGSVPTGMLVSRTY